VVSDPAMKLHFFRPLASLTHALDHYLFGAAPVAEHAHNLLWYALLLAALWCVLRRGSGPRWVAALALLLYAIDECHGGAVRWISNRNGLMAPTFGFLAVWAHDRWRRDGWLAGAGLAPAFFALAMGSAEGGVATLGYLMAYAVCLDRATWPRRAVTLAPYAAIVVGFVVAYRVGGFGARNAIAYVDPGTEPLRFVATVVSRVRHYLHSMIAGPPAEAMTFYEVVDPALPYAMWAFAMVTVVGFLWLTRPLLRRDPDSRFWLLGAALAAVPICAGFPADRQLMFSSAGILAVVARFLAAFASERAALFPTRGRRRLATIGVVLLFLSAVPISAALMIVRTSATSEGSRVLVDASLPRDAEVAGQTLVVVNTPLESLNFYTHFARAVADEVTPAVTRVLSCGGRPLRIERLDDHTLRIGTDRYLMILRRNPGRELRVGDRVDLPGMHVVVEQVTEQGVPTVARYRFDVPLESSTLRWQQWGPEGFTAFTPPSVGGSVELGELDLVKVFSAKTPPKW
jgi:hypothetical protein